MERQIFTNGKDAHLTTWATSDKERKENPEITFLLTPAKEPKPGDVLEARKPQDGIPGSYYILDKISETRPANMRGFNFIRATATHKTNPN